VQEWLLFVSDKYFRNYSLQLSLSLSFFLVLVARVHYCLEGYDELQVSHTVAADP